jgi:hypothetical protein
MAEDKNELGQAGETQSFTDDEAAAVPQTPTAENEEIIWTASEFIHHEKASGWYLLLIVAAFAGGAVIYFLTRDFISAGAVLVGALFLAIMASRHPRQLDYRLDGNGIGIGERYQEYEEFRSFAVVPESGLSSIIFMPLKRFSPHTIIYYDPSDEDKIITLLNRHLPFEAHQPDVVEKVMRRIRY